MHKDMAGDCNKDVGKVQTHIFFSDAPHLLKTARNFLYSSGSALYNSSTDPRFDWLQSVFLQFLVDWRESIDSREGDFNETARSKMFISWQKFEGFQVTFKIFKQKFWTM